MPRVPRCQVPPIDLNAKLSRDHPRSIQIIPRQEQRPLQQSQSGMPNLV